MDHWSCHVEYTEVNQSITFQNWHSLGLGSVPKGLPVRVTGGNSAPNPTKGSPRLNTVWYTNFSTGPSSVNPSLFEKPAWICIPVGLDAVEAYFGHKVTPAHVHDAGFQQRAHFLPSAMKPTGKDMKRAIQVRPREEYLGKDFTGTMAKLNKVLADETGLSSKPCANFSLEELHELQSMLFEARSPALQSVYHGVKDTRSMAHSSTEEHHADMAAQLEAAKARPELADTVRDGVCHESVMWYVHHMSEATREEVKQLITLPLLPEVEHKVAPHVTDQVATKVHDRYKASVSCAVCHVA